MKSLLIAAVVLGLGAAGAPAFAQAAVTGTASTTAQIIQPISFGTSRALVFGNIVPSNTAGAVTISADAASTAAATGGVTLIAGGAARQSAQFTVNADASNGATYNLTFPSSTVTLSSGGDNMTLTPSLPALSTNLSGNTTPYVGGSLAVAANQAAGAYTGTVSLTATYN